MRPARFPYLEHDGLLAFAHRGGASDAPENTMPAFQRAVDMGYRYIETDVHATRDGVLLAFHDECLDRVTDRTGVIAEMDYAQVRDARVDGSEPIPLMAELLAAWPEVRFNIDPKADNAVGPLVDVIREAQAVDRVGIGSFSDRRLAQFRDAFDGRICTSTGPMTTARLRFASWSGPLAGLWGRFAAGCTQVPLTQYGITLVDASYVARCHKLGLQVHVWTIDEPDEMERLIDLGVDGLMTDRPAVLKEVCERRGIWA